jgi:hypothetical protein
MKMHAENDLLMMEISKCSQDYIENRCYPSERVRALEDFCNEKELCMNRDPATVNKNTKIMVKLLAEIINDFFEPRTYKTIILISLALIVMILFSECLVGRSRSNGIVRSKKEV